MIRRCQALFAALSGLTFAAVSASAQSVNYGKLEQLFGEPVTIDATGSPQRVSDAPVNMQIITADDIRRSGADNIPDILAMVPGIDVRRYGMDQVDVSVRGYDQPFSPRLLVLIDGRQTYNDSYGYVSWQTLPVQLDEIRQIEVVKGPNSALFGFNAVGGVVNIITYDPLSDSKNSVTLRGGTQDSVGGSAVGTAHWGDVAGLRLSAGSSRSDEFSTGSFVNLGSGHFDNRPYHDELSLDSRIKVTPDIETMVAVTSTDSRNFEMPPPETPNYADTYRTNSVKFGLKATTSLGLVDVNAYRNSIHSDLFGETLSSSPDTTTPVDLTDTVYVVQASDLFKLLSANTIRIGLEYRNNSASSTSFFGGSVGYDVFAGSAMWTWQVTPEFALTNSLRVDHLNLNYAGTPIGMFSAGDYRGRSLTATSFNAGAVFKPDENDTFRLMVARGIQAPSLIDFGIQAFGFSGSPLLQPSSITNYEVDYDRTLSPWGATLRTALYYQDTDDLIGAFGTSIVNGISYAENYGSSNALGGEIGLASSGTGLRWNVSYAFESIADTLDVASTSSEAGLLNYSHGTPTNSVKGGIGYTWGNLECDGQARWQSRYTEYTLGPNALPTVPTQIDNFITVGARVGYTIDRHATLSVSAQQLNQMRILETAGPPVERRILFSITLRP